MTKNSNFIPSCAGYFRQSALSRYAKHTCLVLLGVGVLFLGGCTDKEIPQGTRETIATASSLPWKKAPRQPVKGVAAPHYRTVFVRALGTAGNNVEHIHVPGKRPWECLTTFKKHAAQANIAQEKRLEACSALEPLWTFAQDCTPYGYVLAPPVVKEGRIFFLSAKQRVVALDMATGNIVWSFSAHDTDQGVSKDALGGGLTLDDKALYVTCARGDVMALNAMSGKLLWRKQSGTPFRSPVQVDHRVESGEKLLYTTTIHHEIEGLQVHSGDVIWTHTAPSVMARCLTMMIPAVTEHSLIMAESGGHVIKINKHTGDVLWSHMVSSQDAFSKKATAGSLAAAVVVSDNTAYVTTLLKQTLALDLTQGQKKWVIPVGSVAPPLRVGDAVYIVGDDHVLTRVEANTGHFVWRKDLRQCISAKDAEEDNDEKEQWLRPIVVDETLYVLSRDGRLIALNMHTGHFYGTLLDLCEACAVPPVVVEDKLLIVTCEGRLRVYRFANFSGVHANTER